MQRLIRYLLVMLCIGVVPLLAQSEAQQTQPAEDTSAVSVDLPEPPAPPTIISVSDTPNDNGHAVDIKWERSADDGAGRSLVSSYEIYRSQDPAAPDTAWKNVGFVPHDTVDVYEFTDQGSRDLESTAYLPKDTDLYYRVASVSDDTLAFSAVSEPVRAQDDWFNTSRIIVLVFVVMFVSLTVIFINVAKQGKELYVRPLAGIEAVDEAIGRATEMGRPILYVLGLGTASDIATIASFSVLGRVARKVAEYQTPILVPCYDPIVLTVAEETVKTGYSDAGRPDDFKEDSVYFVTQSQFAYVAAVNGTMLRERPATNIYLGKFYAESLLLAETGALAGSIQISGTDEIAQLPFFVVACDYTLIGEELYAASVYLNREPILLGTLKAQDWAKAFVIAVILCGLALRAIEPDWVPILLQSGPE